MNNVKLIIIFFAIINCYILKAIGLDFNRLTNVKSELVERIEFTSNNDTLVGYLSKPDYLSMFPVIIVLHSSGHGHHDNAIYNHLEKNMNEVGVGVFTFDRRGIGESGGKFETANFENLANDALQAVEILKKRNDIDISKIGLFGISQGGWIAPVAYTLNRKDISFMILVSSCGVSPAKQMEYSAITTLKMNGRPEEIIPTAKHLINFHNEYFRGNKARDEAQREIDKYKNEEWFNDTYLYNELPEDVCNTKWIHEMDFDPLKYFESVNIPLALFYGEFDRWVPIKQSHEIWENALKKAGNNAFEIFQIKQSGHMMILNEDKNPEEEIISNQYSILLKDWILRTIK
ncbi:MAG: alpha/beta hydrolase [Vicingaceae bacterium]|nr:MAG: alpha/beta hydrolase [Vicingaceae bacterium]